MTRVHHTSEHMTFGWGTLAYARRRGAGRPWLFLHGSGCDSADWRALVDRLPGRWPMACLDWRGHGRSSVPSRLFTATDLVRDLIALIERLALGPCVLVGHSLGGMMAKLAAETRPDLAAGLVMLEGWTHLRAAGRLRDRMFGALPDPIARAIRAKAERTFAAWPAGMHEAFWQTLSAFDGEPFMAGAEAPILELYGDRGLPRPSREALAVPDRPNIRLDWLPGAGHYLPHEQPEAVARRIVDWAARESLAAD